jgi:hypothetical protein
MRIGTCPNQAFLISSGRQIYTPFLSRDFDGSFAAPADAIKGNQGRWHASHPRSQRSLCRPPPRNDDCGSGVQRLRALRCCRPLVGRLSSDG